MESKHDYDQPPRLENEDSYEEWKKALQLWSIVTDIPKDKQAIAVALRLNGKARKAALEIKMGDLNSDAGIEILLKKLDDILVIDPMTIYKAFRDFDSLKKRPFETYKTFVKNFIALYTRLKEVGVAFSERLLTLKFISSVQLSDSQAMDIQCRTGDGSFESAIINLLCFVDEPRTFDFRPKNSSFLIRPLAVAVTTARTKPTEKSVSGADIFKLSSLSTITTSSASYLSTQQKIQFQKSDSTFKGTLVAERKPGPWDCSCCNSKKLSKDTKCASCNTSLPATPKTAAKTSEKPGMFNFGATQASQSSCKPVTTFNKTMPTFGVQQSQTGLFGAAPNKSLGDSGWNFKFQTSEEKDRSNKKLRADEGAEKATTSKQHNDTGPDFEPLVNLPEVEVRTGEEDENIMFSERAKLFRWHDGQWKERGIGEMKILKHNQTGKYRLLMRRDQVLKICCNHLIGKALDLKPMPRSDRAFVWHAMDFSDEEGCQEGFAVRFKTVEIGDAFKKKFSEGKEENMILGTPIRPDPKQPESVEVVKASENLDELLKPGFPSVEEGDDSNEDDGAPSGSSYETCECDEDEDYEKNKKVCSTEKQTVQSKLEITDQSASELTAQSESDKTTKSASNDLQQNSSEGNWVFVKEYTNQTPSVEVASFVAMSSGVPNIGFKKDPEFQFPGAGQVMFQSQTTEQTGESDPTSYKCEAQFKPVLAEPPPLIEVKTGEGEEVLFKERCTLFRYDKETKQWKERGRGDIKILRNDQHNIYRVVMRREQIFKVCANHVINDTTKPEPHLGSVKTCSYFAMDYTESTTPTGEKFGVRFKTEELCKVYMDKIEEIKKIQNSQQ